MRSSFRFYHPPNIEMDTGRLPAYRSSYLLRFHPYPRVKPSTRERIMAATFGDESYTPQQVIETDISSTLNQAIHATEVHTHLHPRRLSVSSPVVDLALLFTKRMVLQDELVTSAQSCHNS
ncbi:hypothetical protein EV363DRAFT_1209269, partial [Boletus edulis]